MCDVAMYCQAFYITEWKVVDRYSSTLEENCDRVGGARDYAEKECIWKWSWH